MYLLISKVMLAVLDGTKEAVKNTETVCLANYPLMTMFRTAEVEFRQVNIVPANTLLPYTATLRVLNEFDRDGMLFLNLCPTFY